MNVEKSKCWSLVCHTRVDMYSDQILEELDEYIHKNQQREEKENLSLDTVFTVSDQLQSITLKQECSGREVLLK